MSTPDPDCADSDLTSEKPTMTYHDKVQLTLLIIAPADLEAEGDRLFQRHGAWMEATHHRTGEKALLSYNVSKAKELSNPGDLNSAPTGNTYFIITEIYESKAGPLDHIKQAHETWTDFPAWQEWTAKCKVTFVAAASIINSLW